MHLRTFCIILFVVSSFKIFYKCTSILGRKNRQNSRIVQRVVVFEDRTMSRIYCSRIDRNRGRRQLWLESSTESIRRVETNRVLEERKSAGLVLTRYSALCPRDPDLFFRIRYCDYYYMITFKRNKKKKKYH